jgi:hypothetical protein
MLRALVSGLVVTAVWVQWPAFEPVQPELFADGGTFVNAFADFDADGDLDLFVGFNSQPDRLYRNDDGVFRDVAATAGVADSRPTRAAAWGDYDADGDADLLVGLAPGDGSILRLYRNDGARFSDVTSAAGMAVDSGAVRQLVWVDYDRDGDADLFVAFRDRANALFRNDEGRFTDVAASVGLADTRRTVGAVWFDYDMDGDLDLYTGNMDGDANGLFRNDGGTFTDVALAAGLAWGGRAPGEAANGTVRPCLADVDNDGRLDLFMANYGPNGLFLNRGNGQFEDVSEQWGIARDARYDACAFADVDHDGRIDLFVNGTVTGGVSYRDYLFRNTGQGFEDVTPANIEALQADHGVQWADIDRDGDQDLALTGARQDGMHALLRNRLAEGFAQRSIQIFLVDVRNRPILAGAEVRVAIAGTNERVGTGIVDSGSGYNSQNLAPLHFGLARVSNVDIEVTVPGPGRVSGVVRDVDPSAYRGTWLTLRADDTGGVTIVR